MNLSNEGIMSLIEQRDSLNEKVNELKELYLLQNTGKYKVVKEFKRGENVPENAKYLTTRLFKKYDFTNCRGSGKLVEKYYIDIYEVGN